MASGFKPRGFDFDQKPKEVVIVFIKHLTWIL